MCVCEKLLILMSIIIIVLSSFFLELYILCIVYQYQITSPTKQKKMNNYQQNSYDESHETEYLK